MIFLASNSLHNLGQKWSCPCYHARHLQQIHWSKLLCGMYGFMAKSSVSRLNICQILMRLLCLFVCLAWVSGPKVRLICPHGSSCPYDRATTFLFQLSFATMATRYHRLWCHCWKVAHLLQFQPEGLSPRLIIIQSRILGACQPTSAKWWTLNVQRDKASLL